MDAFNFHLRCLKNNFIDSSEPPPESVTAMFSAQPRTPAEAGPAASEDILSELKAARPKPPESPRPQTKASPLQVNALPIQSEALPFQAPSQTALRNEKKVRGHSLAEIERPAPEPGRNASVAAAVPASSAPSAGEFTRLFQAILPDSSPLPGGKARPAAGPFEPQPAEKKARPAPELTSIFTQLPTPLQRSAPSRPPQQASPRQLPPAVPPPAPAEPPQAMHQAVAQPSLPPDATQEPGEFTRMMQAFASSGEATSASAGVGYESAVAPATQANTAFDPRARADIISPDCAEVVPLFPANVVSSDPNEPPLSDPAAAASPESFTSFFNAVPGHEASRAQPAGQPSSPQGAPASNALPKTSPAIPAEVPGATLPHASQSTFPDPLQGTSEKAFQQAPANVSRDISRDSLTRIFEAPTRETPLNDRTRQLEPRFPLSGVPLYPPANLVSNPESGPESGPQTGPDSGNDQGGFTKLFRSLSEEELAPRDRLQFGSQPLPPPPPPVQQSPMQPGGGEFTRIFQALGESPSPSAVDFFAPSPVAPASEAQQGPGEFTRIISASGSRDLPGAAEQNAPPATASPIASAAPPPSAAFPPPPKVPSAPPFAVPSASPGPPPPAAQPAAAPAFPPAAAPKIAPPKMPPAPAAPAAPKSKLQEYLPILLVANAFLILLLVVLVIFALRHH